MSKKVNEKYVVGFLFSTNSKEVVLISKKRPGWQAGLLNGVGGHIEQHETRDHAMVREFEEETGLCVDYWQHYAVIRGLSYTIYFYYALSNNIHQVKTMTDEEVVIVPTDSIPSLHTVPNLPWLVPMALDKHVKSVEIEQ